MSKFSDTADYIQKAVMCFLPASDHREGQMDSSLSSETIAEEIHDLDYISGFADSLWSLATNERRRKFEYYKKVKEWKEKTQEPTQQHT